MTFSIAAFASTRNRPAAPAADGKVSKRSVRYRRAGALARRKCGSCSMFQPARQGGGAHCTLVAGIIAPGDVCDRWQAKPL